MVKLASPKVRKILLIQHSIFKKWMKCKLQKLTSEQVWRIYLLKTVFTTSTVDLL